MRPNLLGQKSERGLGGDMVGDVVRRWPSVIWVTIGAGLLTAAITACGSVVGTGPSHSNGSDGITSAASSASPAARGLGNSAETGSPSSLQAGATGVGSHQGKQGTSGQTTGTAAPTMKMGGDPVPPPGASFVAPVPEGPSISGPASGSPTPSTSSPTPSIFSPSPLSARPAPGPAPDSPPVSPEESG